MTSVLNVDTIAAKDGTSAATLTKQTAAKVLCTCQPSATIRTSFNVSSTADSETGKFQVNFTSAMSGTEFTPTGSNIGDSTTSLRTTGLVSALNANTTTKIDFATVETEGSISYTDWTHVNTVVHGDLA